MSSFPLLSADISLWEHTTKAIWRLLDFCLMVMWFQVHTIMHRQLTALSQAGAWGDVEKPHRDMAFILIPPSLSIGCKLVFSLMAMWMNPCQIHLPTLAETAPNPNIVGWWRYWLAIYLCQNEQCHGPCTFVQWEATLASWLVAYQAGMPVASYTN